MAFLTELCNLQGKTIYLASRSPRRIELLKKIGLQFQVFPADVPEEPPAHADPVVFVRSIASEKARLVFERTNADLVIAADTAVVLENRIFGKPADREHARQMLAQLAGKTHHVITGLCLLTPAQEILDHEITEVQFCSLSPEEIEAYLNTGEPFDKAGAYGIQGYAALFVEKISGCYYNVMGFPLHRFYQHLKELNW